MKKCSFCRIAGLTTSVLATLILVGCGTPAPKDFSGAWRPVNRFQNTTTEIPLARPYTYFASPMDGTLKTMLTRWSKDSGMTLAYRLPSDFTLFTPVTTIHTASVRAAAAQLSSIYAPQGVSVTADNRQILVQAAGTTVPTPAPAIKTGAGTPSSDVPAGSK